jgi:hypothetical protein
MPAELQHSKTPVDERKFHFAAYEKRERKVARAARKTGRKVARATRKSGRKVARVRKVMTEPAGPTIA